MGMRGKKLFYDGSYKRAPLGFMGMRGKKSSYSSPLAALLAQSYMMDELAGETPQFNDYQDLYESENYEKRAPANGFFGMRGKKWDDNDLMEEYVKRAPTSSFYGMRGKKQYGSWTNDLDNEKRAPKVGFHGMRGKRSTRGQNRNDLHGYFSVLKRSPYEFRTKFVGVRGKKTVEGSSLLNYLSADIQDAKGNEFEKRAPANGFFGMRGKKS